MNRRAFLRFLLFLWGTIPMGFGKIQAAATLQKFSIGNLQSTVFRVLNNSPSENMNKIIENMGGINKFINTDDVVLIKPNAQWWDHGAINLSALKTLVEAIFMREGGFTGEVVFGENCHRGATPWEAENSAWSRQFERNADIDGILNLNQLSSALKSRFGSSFSAVHWINVDVGGEKASTSKDQTGYVYCNGTSGSPELFFHNGLNGPDGRYTMATYPVFKTDRGTIVDFRKGIYTSTGFNQQRLKFINFSALNHHSPYVGMTSCIKNYMGITDLSGGPDPFKGGELQFNVNNFHSFPFNKHEKGPADGMLGAEIGYFMNRVRKADLNFVSAEWIGLSSRIGPPFARTRAIIASTDPVALDYHSSKYILYPNSKIVFHNPDWIKGPLYQYLKACSEKTRDTMDEKKVNVISFDFKAGRWQKDDQLEIKAEKYWGKRLYWIKRYLVLRFLPNLAG